MAGHEHPDATRQSLDLPLETHEAQEESASELSLDAADIQALGTRLAGPLGTVPRRDTRSAPRDAQTPVNAVPEQISVTSSVWAVIAA